jgi:hypothetical protein
MLLQQTCERIYHPRHRGHKEFIKLLIFQGNLQYICNNTTYCGFLISKAEAEAIVERAVCLGRQPTRQPLRFVIESEIRQLSDESGNGEFII